MDINMAKSPTKAKRERNQELATKYYLQGHTLRETAERINQETGQTISHCTVSKWIDKAIVGWRSDKAATVESHKEIELAKINKLETEAWDAWFNSKGGQLVENEKHRGPLEGTLTILERGKSKKQTYGDARYLDLVKWCIEARCKILGVEMPIPIDPTGTGEIVSSSTTTIRRVVFRTRKQIQEGRAAQEVEGSPETMQEAS